MKRESLIENRDKLLWDILQELKILTSRQGEDKGEVGGELQPVAEKKVTDDKKVYKCKYCGGEHDKPQQIAVCARKQKQKG